jgi:hypothetical protein
MNLGARFAEAEPLTRAVPLILGAIARQGSTRKAAHGRESGSRFKSGWIVGVLRMFEPFALSLGAEFRIV